MAILLNLVKILLKFMHIFLPTQIILIIYIHLVKTQTSYTRATAEMTADKRVHNKPACLGMFFQIVLANVLSRTMQHDSTCDFSPGLGGSILK